MSEEIRYELEVVKWEGKIHCAYLNNFRIAGSKPWAGGQTVKKWSVIARDVIQSIPELQTLSKNFDEAQSELAALREELAVAKHDIASFLETTAKVCDLLCIDTEDAKHAKGNPSDVFFSHATALSKRLTAAEQRNASLLETAQGLTIQLHATIGNTEHHEDCIRDLAALQPTESGASE